MEQIQQQSVKTWSCVHFRYLRADLIYEITQERGYDVSRLRSLTYLEAPPFSSGENSRRLDNVIPFPSRRRANFSQLDALQSLFARWLEAEGK
ncbi:MAG: hypothetical protein HY648_01265 [Acidobacteria bacterium]|nr:hypothetical protein [Acidobacteriota bacterium]